MYFALHNNNIRAVLNRMKVNTVHVWQDSRDEMCKFSGQEAVWFSFNEETANCKGRMQARGHGRHLSKLLNSWRKAQFGRRSVDRGNVKGGGPRELSNMVAAVLTHSDVHSLGTAQTIGTQFYKRWSHVATGEISSSHWLSNIRGQRILTRLQRGCKV